MLLHHPGRLYIGNSTLQALVLVFGALLLLVSTAPSCQALIPLIDGGKTMPKLYNCYFDSQLAKQASTAVGKAVAAGKTRIEVYFSPVPNVDEVRFGTPLNKQFGTNIVAKDLKVVGGYKPGSDLSRQQVAFANVYWAKQIASSLVGGNLFRKVDVVSAEPVTFAQLKDTGVSIGRTALLGSPVIAARSSDACIAINPGGEETWERWRNSLTKGDKSPFLILNNAYSTTYGLGNKAGYDEAYYLKRISKGYIFRTFPGPWCAYLEKPDGGVELLESYKEKPQLNAVATLVRDESFRRFAIGNDRWSKGFGERL